MTSKRRLMSLFLSAVLIAALFAPMGAGAAEEALTLEKINEFLNSSADLGEGSKANAVAIIPINHINGPREEDTFYAFVTFKYLARSYIKYQVNFISCTCRSADVNYWSTAFVELTLPESGLLDDAAIRTLSFDQDSTGHYQAGFWGDSNPIPSQQTYEMIKTEYIPYYVGKTYGQIKGLSTTDDIDLADYQAGEGRGEYTIDTFTGASVSTNNILRMLHAIFQHHGTDPFFANDPSLVKAEAPTEAMDEKAAEPDAGMTGAAELLPLPAPVDETKTFKKNKDDKEEVPCTPGDFGPTCSAIGAHNLLQYLNRPDVFYIDVRDHNDYMKKHLRNFEVIPFFGLIFNADAAQDESKPHLYGGTPAEPIPMYEESDEILAALFPKDKTLFLMCQSGGRVGMLMNILKARGWDMSKVYNIGGMAQYTGPEYRSLITDTPEMVMEITYNMEGLTKIKP